MEKAIETPDDFIKLIELVKLTSSIFKTKSFINALSQKSIDKIREFFGFEDIIEKLLILDVNITIAVIQEIKPIFFYYEAYPSGKYVYSHHPLQIYISLKSENNISLNEFLKLYDFFRGYKNFLDEEINYDEILYVGKCFNKPKCFNIHDDYFGDGLSKDSLFSVLMKNMNSKNYEIFSYLLVTYNNYNFTNYKFFNKKKFHSNKISLTSCQRKKTFFR